MDISSYIDHTLLKPTASFDEIERLCEEAIRYGFAAVCIPPPMLKLALQLTASSHVKRATVVGFPLGYACTASKLEEVELALADQADELDVVINLIDLKNGRWDLLEKEISALCQAVHREGKIIKVIIESGVLTDREIIRCCEIFGALEVDFLKTSTGYAEKGATVGAVRLMRDHLPPSVSIKASGGIRTYEFARQLIDAGASRLGSSAGVSIVESAMAQG